MALLDILVYPDERLHRVAEPVTLFDEHLDRLIDDMLETMYDAPGIGLAAIQVDVPLQVVVIDMSSTRDQPLVLINPVIVEAEGEVICEEGCLSVPEIREKVRRYETVVVEALDRSGKPIRIEADDYFSVCLQHEIDHLNGVVFVDRLSRLKQGRVRSRLKKMAKEQPVKPGAL